MASARGPGKAGAYRSSPARAAALIGGAALLLLVGGKLAGFLTRGEPGRTGLDRAGGQAHAWLEQWAESSVSPAPDAGDPVAAGLAAALGPLGVPAPEIQREAMPEVETGRRRTEQWRVPLPARVSPTAANLAVTRAVSGLGLQVLDAWEERESSDGPVLTVVLGRGGAATHRLEFVRREGPAGGLIALVIDDFGFPWDETAEAFLRFPAPLTVGVLPGYRSSRQVADAARARGFEVVLHLPMEPERYPQVKPGPGAILVDQAAAEVRATLRRALRSVGNVEGISSHMGSRATTDRDLMKTVLDETGRQGLYFIDTRTTPKSVVEEVARQLGTPVLVNGMHLDEVRKPKVIAERMAEAMEIAEEKGAVVVVAHGYRETLSVLEEALPVLEHRGLRLVTASELVKAKSPEPL